MQGEEEEEEDEWWWKREIARRQSIEWKRETAIKQVKRLSGQIGLRHQVPKVIFDPAELDETMRELINKQEVPDWHQNCGGAYFPHIHTIYLNVLSFGDSTKPGSSGNFIGDMMETIGHELAHARFPGLPIHGDEFEKRVRQILNGKRFPWVILRKPILQQREEEGKPA
jgi:hypothetical protein